MAFQALPGFNGDLITGSLTASQSANQQDQNYSIEVQGEVVFFAFRPYFSTNNFFAPANGSPFGEIKMNRVQFPCMRSIGGNEDATVNEAFLKNLEVLIDPRTSFYASVKMAVDSKKQIVFTGHSSGGATAILATVWYLEKYLIQNPNGVPEPRCVTFGAPLVGDSIFNHALGRENWSRFFLNFVTRFDIVPRIMLARKASIEQTLLPYVLSLLEGSIQESDERLTEFYKTVMQDTSTVAYQAVSGLTGNTEGFLETFSSFLELSPYKPVGNFVFSREERLVAMNNSDAILQMLFYTFQSSDEQEWSQIPFLSISDHHSYKEMVQSIGTKSFNQLDLNHLPLDGENSLESALNDFGLNTRAKQCVQTALKAEKQRVENQTEIETKKTAIEDRLKWIVDEYKPKCQKKGYYDSFKASNVHDDFQANVKRAQLAGIFDEVLGLVRKGQLPDEFEGRIDWIELANRYRRLIEPLDIANYYRHIKNEDTGLYMDQGRPKRYIYAHRGYEHDQLKPTGVIAEDAFWSKVNALNLGPQEAMPEVLKMSGSKCGSCFWAEVEELKGKKDGEDVVIRVKTLEGLLDGWIEDGEVDKEIFLEDSTFMKWWNTFPDNHKSQSPVKKYIMGETGAT